MTITIIKIVLIILLIRVLLLSLGHLLTAFWDEANKMAVNEILKDPSKYVRDEHIGIFFTNMIWVYVFIQLLICVFKGNLTIN